MKEVRDVIEMSGKTVFRDGRSYYKKTGIILGIVLAVTFLAGNVLGVSSSNVIKLAAKEETAEDHRILKELQKELIRKKRQQKQTEAAPSEKGYRKGQRAEA